VLVPKSLAALPAIPEAPPPALAPRIRAAATAAAVAAAAAIAIPAIAAGGNRAEAQVFVIFVHSPVVILQEI